MSENEGTQPSTTTETSETTEEDKSLIGGAEPEVKEVAEDGKEIAEGDKKAAAETDDKKEGEGDKKEGKDAPSAVVVENIKFPEGFQRNDETLKAFTDALGDAKLSPQDRAQALVDLHTKALQDVSARADQQWQDERSKWVDATKALPKIGGENLDASLGKIAKLIEEFGKTTDAQGVESKELGEQFRQVLDDSGLGDHPTVVRFLVNVSNSFGEGSPVSGDATTGEKTAAQKLYPDMN